MGGKTQRAQRTKNNARPSSSGRSAELLSNTLKDPALFGAGSGQPLKPLFPTLATVNFELGLNTEYTLCFKKFNKKDPITKTKALQELHELTKAGDTEDVVAALPAWAHFYPILTIDNDRKVRECTQVCHASVVRACGRRLAPQLRRLLPAWLLALNDDYAPAQHHAHAALTSTFPEGKLADAISFCKAEITNLLLENLSGNAEGMLVKKFDNEEERRAQVRHVVASSLRALRLLAARLPREHDAWLRGALGPLLRAPAFWAHVHSSAEAHVRGAWYGAVGRLAERFGEQLGAEWGARAARALLALPERPPAAAQRWAALLALMRNVTDWHSWLDKKDLLAKRILEVLENGGWGEARALAALLPSLLEHLPPDLRTQHFYDAFFNAMLVGLGKKNILSSKSERQAWIGTVAECLRHLSEQRLPFAHESVAGAHRAWLRAVLAVPDAQQRSHLIRHSAASTTALFKCWLEHTEGEDGDRYDRLLRSCWQNLGHTIAGRVAELAAARDARDLDAAVSDHILLLQSLKTAFEQDDRKRPGIKFADELPAQAESEAATAAEWSAHEACRAGAASRYRHELRVLAERSCALYLELALNDDWAGARAVLPPLLTLLVEFESASLYATLAQQMGAANAHGLYERALRERLARAGDAAAEVGEPLLDLVFLSLKYMSEAEQDRVFDSFEQLEQRAAERCLALCLAHPHCTARAPARWLRGARAQRALPPLCARALRDGDMGAGALLLRCLTHSADGESVASEQTVGEVVRQVCAAVAAAELGAAQLERRARTAAQLCGALAAARSPHAAALAALAAALFSLQLHVPRGDERLPLDTWLEARSSWQDALGALPPAARRSLLADMVALLHRKLFDNAHGLDAAQIDNMVALLPYALSAAQEARHSRAVAAFAALALALPERPAGARSAELCALRSDCVAGRLSCPLHDDSHLLGRIVERSASAHADELDGEEFLFNARKWLFKASFLRSILLRRTAGCDDEEEGEAGEEGAALAQARWCNDIFKEEYIQDEFLTLLHDHMVLTTLDERYAFWLGYETIHQTKLRLDAFIAEVIEETSADTRRTLLDKLTEKAAGVGYYWSYARCYWRAVSGAGAGAGTAGRAQCLHNDGEREGAEVEQNADVATGSDDKDTHGEDIDLMQIVTGSGYFHSLQADLKWRGEENEEDVEARLRCRFAVALRGVHAAHGAELRARAVEWGADAARCVRDLSLDPLLDLHCRHPDLVLAEREILSASWAHVVSNAALLDLADELVRARGWDLPSHHWDFVTLTLAALVESLALSVDNWGCTKVALLCRSALQLFARVRSFVAGVRRASEQRRPSAHLLALVTEWNDVFAPAINTNLFKIITAILRSPDGGLTCSQACAAGALAAGAAHLQWELLPAELRAGELARTQLARAACDALREDARAPVQLLAYMVLRALAEGLVLEDAQTLAQWREREEGAAREEGGAHDEGGTREESGPRGSLSLAYCDTALTQLQELLDTALAGVGVCESCELVAGSAGERVARAYLLLATAVHEQYRLARGDLPHHYIEHYRARKYGQYMIACSVRLLPAALAAFARDDTAATPLPARLLPHFAAAPDLTVQEVCLPEAVGVLACRALMASLEGGGCADARGWWGALGARPARAVRRLVAACVAPPLHRAQLADLKRRAAGLPDTQVSVAWGGEARCVLQVEDRALELCVQLSDAHPLVPPRVTADALPAAPDAHWLTVYLAYQNGSLYKAFKMWIRSVSTRIENSPQCYICYCRLHPATGRLPSTYCRQCRNKFHAPCLRKWFTTSNKSKCPLCRSNF